MFGGPAKTTEPIAMPFGMWTLVGPRNHVLDDGPDRPMQGPIFREMDILGHAQRHCALSYAKMAVRNQMPFGLWTRVWSKQHVLG